MENNFATHWFMKEEVKWRNIAAAFWAYFATAPLTAIFFFGISIDLSRHVFLISDFVAAVVSLQFLTVCIICGILSSILVFLYSHHLTVSATAPLNRLQFVRFILQPSNLVFLLISTAFFFVVSGLLISLRFSTHLVTYPEEGQANTEETEKWLMAEHISTMAMLFGCTAGFFHSISKLLSYKMQLEFLKVQESKFLYLKCKLPCVLSHCAACSARYLYRFLILYYVIEFAVITTVNSSNLSIFSYLFSFRLWWVFDMIPMLWSLWLTGTWCLLLYDLSWHILNAFQTQVYPFTLAHTLFSAEDEKQLIKNLSEATPPLVQYHAFHQLSLFVKQRSAKRQHIFSLSRSIENRQPVICKTIMKSCLDRIHKLTDDIASYQSSLLETIGFQDDFKKGSESSHNSISADDDVKSTPRLWARFHDSKIQQRKLGKTEDVRPCPAQESVRSNMSGIFGAMSISAPQPRMAPALTLQNIYRDQNVIVKWCLQTISYLCLTSVEEDEFGVVQGHLREVLIVIIELKKVLESVEKNAQSVSALSKLHQSLYFEVKSSLYRMTAAYGTDLLTISLNAEQMHVMQGFINYEE